jgi:hypothetical protein
LPLYGILRYSDAKLKKNLLQERILSDLTTFANSTLLKPTKWVADTLFVAPGGHRFRNALGLSVGLFAGDKFSSLITGQKFNGEKISIDEYPAFLHPLYNIMPYNRFSDDPADRWKFVARGFITAGFGAAGAMLGSYDYFLTKTPNVMEQLKNPWHHSKYKLTDAHLQDYFIANHSTVASATEKAAASGRLTDEIVGNVKKWLEFTSPHNMDKHVYDEMSKAYLLPAGLAAIPGSASGSNVTPFPLYPWLLNERFKTGMLGYKVAMPVFGKWWSNSAIPDKFSANHLLDEIVRRVGDPKNLNLADAATQSNLAGRIAEAIKGAIEPIYKDLTKDQILAMRDEILSVSKDSLKRLEGLSPKEFNAAVKAESEYVTGTLNKTLKGTGLNQFLHRNGVDLAKVNFEDHGFSGWLAKLMGANIKQHTYEFQRSLKLQGLPNNFDLMNAPKQTSKAMGYIKQTAAVVGATAAMGGVTAGAIHLLSPQTFTKHLASANGTKPADSPDDGSYTADVTPDIQVSSSNVTKMDTGKPAASKTVSKDFFEKTKDLINGPMLNLTEAGVETFNVAPSGHRLLCATGLMAMMIIGDTLMKAITHRTIAGKEITKDALHPLFHSLFDKKLALYGGRDSSAYSDQWMHILRMFVPSIAGVFGVMMGSNLFFSKKKDQVKHAQFLDEYEQKASFAQSGPWTWLAAIGSLPSSSTGLNLFPIPINYGTALGGRFGLASDRAVLFPGIAEWWSNNHSMYPLQAPALLKRMAAYGAYNPAKDLQQLDEMVPGVLKHWYNNVTQKQIDDFTHAFEKYRAEGIKKGLTGKALEKELSSHITGAGLEETLEMIGMDPAKAILGNNGVSGAIGNFLGAKQDVMQAQIDYIHAYRERKKKRMQEKHHTPAPDNSNEPSIALPTSATSPIDISSSTKWQDNIEKSNTSQLRAEPKPVTSIASRKSHESHMEKAKESKDQPSIGLTA